MSKVRYLIIHKDHPFDPQGVASGAENATRCLASALAELGEEVAVAGQLLSPERTLKGVEYWDLGPEFDVERALTKASSHGAYHLISAGRALPILQSKNDPNCRSRLLITHDRSGNDTGISPSVLCAAVDRIICVSEAQRDVLVRAGVAQDKIEVLWNGVDLNIFKAGEPSRRNYRRMVFSGALVEDKGIHWLLESYCALKSEFPDLLLDVYGSSDLWGRNKLFDEKEIERRVPGVTFHGKVSQEVIAKAFAEAGLCVIPSIWFDPFPLTALEAQACGCPVWTFDVGGLKEGFYPGQTGVLCTDIRPEALTAGLRKLLSDPAGLRGMAEKSLQLSRPRFTWDKVANGVRRICESRALEQSAGCVTGKLGFLSTWNQPCGLATYGRFLFEEFPVHGGIVLAEDSDDAERSLDEPYVRRVWKRGSADFAALEDTIEREGIKLLHLNCHARFFPQPAFSQFLKRIRDRGVKVVTLLHSIGKPDENVALISRNSDLILVHSPESRLECIASGAEPARVRSIPHGVRVLPPLSAEQRADLRAKLGFEDRCTVLVAFGFVQAHKGFEALIEATAVLKSRGKNPIGLILGSTRPDDPSSEPYAQLLKQRALELGVGDRVRFENRFISDDEVSSYLQAADVVFMNYRSQYYEASGACSLAVGAGALTLTSLAPQFAGFGDAVWHLTNGFPAHVAADLLTSNAELADTIRSRARAYAQQHSWRNVARTVLEAYREIGFEISTALSRGIQEMTKEAPVERSVGTLQTGKGRRVLMQNRPNALSQPGGDTILMQKTAAALKRQGWDVTIDLSGSENPSGYDVVHLYNFALPEWLRERAEKAVNAGVPYVVTTLCEDVPRFHNQSREVAARLIEYVARGQDRAWLKQNLVDPRSVTPSGRFNNDWVAAHAAALLANGKGEVEVLRRTYPGAKAVFEVPVGFDALPPVSPNIFFQRFGLKDFVLCVGRLESRKNQLMLLKALEDSELPVVLVDGGFSYQGDYEAAARQLKRKGKTIFTGRLSPEELASAYAACRVHALVSWYELPGLVSLEAAWAGKNVVVTATGTTEDYLGDAAYYAEPDNARSIYNAIVAAYYAPVTPSLQQSLSKFTWDAAGARTAWVYEQCVPASSVSASAASIGGTSWETHLDAGEEAAKLGRYEDAHESLAKAETLNPQAGRVLRSRGTVFLAEGKIDAARSYFERAVTADGTDAKAICGLGMCAAGSRRMAEAHGYFVRALELDAGQLTALHQLISCAYELGRFDDLERCLRRYLDKVGNDPEITFCLAGCLYKNGQLEESTRYLEEVLREKPAHRGATELKAMIASERKVPTGFATTTQTIPASSSWLSAPAPGKPPSVPITVPRLDLEVQKETTPATGPQRLGGAAEIDHALARLEEKKREMNLEEALAEWQKLSVRADLTPEQYETATLLRAEIHAVSGEIEDATRLMKEVLGRNNRSARALAGLGALAAHQNRWDEARKLFHDALSARPNYDVALAGIAVCAHGAGNREEAWQYFSRALAANPENLRALLGTIELAYPMGKLNELEGFLRQYLDMHPADLKFTYSLAGCLFGQGKKEEARTHIDNILLFEPGNQKAIELKEMIEKSGVAGGPARIN